MPDARHPSPTTLLVVIEKLVQLRRDLAFARAHPDELEGASWTIEQAYRRAIDRARDQALPWHVFEFPDASPESDAADAFVSEENPERRRALFIEVLSLSDDPSTNCAEVRDRAHAKLGEINQKIAGLDQTRVTLETLIAACDSVEAPRACPITEALKTRKSSPNKSSSRRRSRVE